MAEDGVRRVVAFATAAYSSYSSCRQYLEDIDRAREAAGAGAPTVDKIRPFFNHPGFVEANRARLLDALDRVPEGQRSSATVLFCAHSIPMSMADTCDYAAQLAETARLVGEGLAHPSRLVFQSRSGPPSQPWLEPDVLDALRVASAEGATAVVLAPIGFVSDHMEVVYDLDVEARAIARELGLELVRAGTAGTHPSFVRMIRELVEERLEDLPLAAVGELAPRPPFCPEGCCPRPARPAPRRAE
jgi:ferrochelatase